MLMTIMLMTTTMTMMLGHYGEDKYQSLMFFKFILNIVNEEKRNNNSHNLYT